MNAEQKQAPLEAVPTKGKTWIRLIRREGLLERTVALVVNDTDNEAAGIAACANACAGMPLATLEAAPHGHAAEWFDAWCAFPAEAHEHHGGFKGWLQEQQARINGLRETSEFNAQSVVREGVREAAMRQQRDELLAALIDVRDNAREDSPDMWRRVDEAIAKVQPCRRGQRQGVPKGYIVVPLEAWDDLVAAERERDALLAQRAGMPPAPSELQIRADFEAESG